MPVAIELFLDEPSANVVRAIWQGIAEGGVSPYMHTSAIRPHLTLAVGSQVDGPAVEAVLREWAGVTAPLQVSFTGLGLTPTAPANIYLTAVVTSNLLALHADLQHKLSGLVESPSERYLPGRWVPHCTLSERVPADLIARALEIARSAPLPLTANLAEIGLVNFSPLLQRATFPLTG
jgi:2'-5' RNA ligase